MRTDLEDGLTLVEMLVALFVVALVLMAMASTAIAALRSVAASERVVRATHLGSEVLEELEATRWEQLGLYEGEAGAVFGGTGQFEGEDLVLFPDPITRDDRVPLPRRELTRDGIDYEVRTAVVWDGRGAEPDSYKRLVVDLTWRLRGEVRTTRVESLVATTPEDQLLSVTVSPEIIRLTASPEGKNAASFVVEAVAAERQSAVKLRWTARDGTPRETSMTGSEGGTRWRTPVNANTRHFANGGTLFEVTATSSDGTRETTTIGRATFLHDLSIPGSRVVVDPSPLHHDPEGGVCTGFEVTVDVIGATLSDPLTTDLAGNVGAFGPLTSLVDGTRYHVAYDAEDLQVAPSDTEVRFRVATERATDLTEAELEIVVPVEQLPEDGSGEVAACPAT